MTVAWYVHHQGAGHQHRALAVLRHVSAPTVALSQLPAPSGLPRNVTWVRLPTDVPSRPVAGDVTASGRLHWAPPQQPETRAWAAAFLRALDEHHVSVMVSDVSVEATVLARTAGVQVVSMRLHGTRRDPAHNLGYELSIRAIAPYPKWFEQPGTPPALRDKTVYVGGLSRFGGTAVGSAATTVRDCRPHVAQRSGGVETVAVLIGSGGTTADLSHLDRLAERSRHRWVGLGRPEGGTGGVQWLGRVVDPEPILRAAAVVVSAAGHNSVMECAALRRPLVCVPEPRPFDEQRARAQLLADLGLAVVVDEWRALRDEHVRQAVALGGAGLGTLIDADAAPTAARAVQALAA